MHVLVTGAAGMLGRKLVESFAERGAPGGRTLDALTLIDVVEPQAPAGVAGRTVARAADIAAPRVAEALIASRPDLVVHLAAVVSGEAEADFDKGYRINLDATRSLFDAIRAEISPPATGRGWCSPRRSPYSAGPSPKRSGTSSSPRR